MTEAAEGIPEPDAGATPRLSAGRALRWAAYAFTVFFFAPYYLTCLYILVDPPISAFMLRQALAGRSIAYEWRDLGHLAQPRQAGDRRRGRPVLRPPRRRLERDRHGGCTIAKAG